jgi:hypothetical protein
MPGHPQLPKAPLGGKTRDLSALVEDLRIMRAKENAKAHGWISRLHTLINRK